MAEVSLKLTSEQMKEVSDIMELVGDSIIVSVGKETINDDNSFVALARTYTIS